MEYLSSRETAEKWGCSLREVQRLLKEGRVAGARRLGARWLLPADAKKPPDPRKERATPDSAPNYLPCVFVTSYIYMPKSGADGLLSRLDGTALSAQYQAELQYMRGEFEESLAYAESVPPEADAYISANAIAMSSAISIGDYDRYHAAVSRLRALKEAYPGSAAEQMSEAALATAEVSMFAPENVPDWLRRCDLSRFPPESRPWLAYLYAKLLQNKREFPAMLGAARSALAFISRPGGFTAAEIYLRLLCAAACSALDDREGCAENLDSALALGLPNGFIMPFAETVTAYGGVLEKLLKRDWPEQYSAVMTASEKSWRSWISFHNRFARDNVTLMLTLREYHLALLLARGLSYSQAAERLHISVGSVNNTASVIYEKLYIRGKSELASFLL